MICCDHKEEHRDGQHCVGAGCKQCRPSPLRLWRWGVVVSHLCPDGGDDLLLVGPDDEPDVVGHDDPEGSTDGDGLEPPAFPIIAAEFGANPTDVSDAEY